MLLTMLITERQLFAFLLSKLKKKKQQKILRTKNVILQNK